MHVGQTVVTTHGTPTVPCGTTGVVVAVVPFAHGTLVQIRDLNGTVHEVNAVYVKPFAVPSALDVLHDNLKRRFSMQMVPRPKRPSKK